MSKTADRTLRLLEEVARADGSGHLVELATRSGLDKSTASRLLNYLEDRSLVHRDEATKVYAVGPALVSLAAIIMRGASFPRVAQTYLDRLRDATEETVSLHVRNGAERVCVGGAESRHLLQRVLTVGDPLPLWEGPTGKVILAHLPDAERERILSAANISERARRQADELIENARAQGWLATVGDRTPEVSALSAPVFDGQGVFASITIAGPDSRWSTEAMTSFAPELVAAAGQLSAEIGGTIP